MRVLALLVVSALLLTSCVIQPSSKVTGGRGQVVEHGRPLAHVTVRIVDIGGRLSSLTDKGGRFDIAVDPQVVSHFPMANPLIHSVRVIVEREGEASGERSFQKGQLGPNYFDFGRLDIAEPPKHSFKPKPLRGSA